MDREQVLEDLKAWLSQEWGGGLVRATDVLDKIEWLEEKYE